ncbi:MAG: Ig-like domain-containing protein [Sandaracinaceae bacterium]|nr:Ig-like domain-containing protein [Sandaracinaceae bacterium]
MRLALALAWLAAATAHANCTPGMLDYERAWPSGGATDVATNARVLVQRFGTTDFRERPVRYTLVPDTGPAVPLRVALDLRSGSRNMHQRTLVLSPAIELVANTRYTLMVGRDPEPQSFTTAAGADTTPPSAGRLRARGFARLVMGCGPADRIRIDVEGTDAPWVRLRIARDEAALAAGRFEGETILVVERGGISFGHDMCIGNWGLEPGQRLFASTILMDVSSNELAAGTLVLDAR